MYTFRPFWNFSVQKFAQFKKNSTFAVAIKKSYL